MTLEEFERRADYNQGYDRVIGGWKVLDVHRIPDNFSERDEVDFYCANDQAVFLLRLRLRKVEAYSILRESTDPNALTYLIAELPFRAIDDASILNVLNRFDLHH